MADLASDFDRLPLSLDEYPPELRSELEQAVSDLLSSPPVSPGAPEGPLLRPLSAPLPLPPLSVWLIGVSGKPHSGKDVFADYLASRYAQVEVLNFSDLVIGEANHWMALTGREITAANKSEPLHRRLLQLWGRARRFESENYWVDSMRERLLEARSRSQLVVLCGVRAESDLRLVEELSGVCVRVNRPGNTYVADDPIESELDGERLRMLELLNPEEGDLKPFISNIEVLVRQLSI